MIRTTVTTVLRVYIVVLYYGKLPYVLKYGDALALESGRCTKRPWPCKTSKPAC